MTAEVAKPTAGWTDARIERMRQMWLAGSSAGMIATDLGYTTRNAVIGKVTRLGLQRGATHLRMPQRNALGLARNPWALVSASARQQRIENSRLARSRNLSSKPARQPSQPLDPQIEVRTVPLEHRRGLLDLGPEQCRWPIGDPGTPEFHFCDQNRAPIGSYCPGHARRAVISSLSGVAANAPLALRKTG